MVPSMQWFRRLRLIRQWLLALYVLSMASLGFAHQALILPAPAPDLSAYVLPDGTLPVVCTPDMGDAPAGSLPHLNAALCDACLLSAAPGLLPCAGVLPPQRVAAAATARFTVVAQHLVPHRGFIAHLRGPPRASRAA